MVANAIRARDTDARLDAGGIVLFARTGATIGKPVWIRECSSYAVFSVSASSCSPTANPAEPAFLTTSFRREIIGRNCDSARRGEPQRRRQATTLKNLEIPLPPLAEQRRIAEVLDRAEALRAKRRAALAQLDSLTQSLFLDLFGDPLQSKGVEPPTTRRRSKTPRWVRIQEFGIH